MNSQYSALRYISLALILLIGVLFATYGLTHAFDNDAHKLDKAIADKTSEKTLVTTGDLSQEAVNTPTVQTNETQANNASSTIPDAAASSSTTAPAPASATTTVSQQQNASQNVQSNSRNVGSSIKSSGVTSSASAAGNATSISQSKTAPPKAAPPTTVISAPKQRSIKRVYTGYLLTSSD